jgi:hypothetical protein
MYRVNIFFLKTHYAICHVVSFYIVSCSRWLTPGANPTIVSYNGGAVKIYNATNSLVGIALWKILLLFIWIVLDWIQVSSRQFLIVLFWPPIYWLRPFISTDPRQSPFYLYIPLYRPLFFSIVLDSKPFGSNKGYCSCSPLPSFP